MFGVGEGESEYDPRCREHVFAGNGKSHLNSIIGHVSNERVTITRSCYCSRME